MYNNTNTLSFEELCYQKFIDSKNDLKTIHNYTRDLNISITCFLLIIHKYIDKNINKPDYVKYLDTINLLESDEEIIKFFEITKTDHNFLKNNLLSYYMNYRPYIFYFKPEEVKSLREKLTKYENYLYRESNPFRTSKRIDLDFANNTINSFINSNYSLNRFCFNNNLTIKTFKSLLDKVKNNNVDLYHEYERNIILKDCIKKETIESDILKILNEIKNNPDFGLIDFCLLTNYDVLELIKVADNMLENDNIKLFRIKTKPFRQIDVLNEERLTRLFKTNFTFNINNELVNVTDEDKYTIINYLNLNNIPICNESFKDSCIKLYNRKKENIIK